MCLKDTHGTIQSLELKTEVEAFLLSQIQVERQCR
ncbi:unnamed protein product [Paramecium octaurelia]|uniref:Uncharacterized protein n=1 Tax=Paramecium octaurelia TaxID=43137 RepID=A0A8S1S4A5_PAROT|nr:unnamed protein product [Paramecium octaurelia]